MIDLERAARDGFKLLNGEIRDKYNSVTLEYDARVQPFGWGSPCTEYRFTNYALSAYSIVKSTQWDEWYLMKDGYTRICTLRYLGGECWETC